MRNVLKLYAMFREPRNFLIILCAYVACSLTAHVLHGWDADFGTTNLVLSIEASIASAAIMMMGRRTAEAQESANQQMRTMVAAIYEMQDTQTKTLKGVLLVAEAQRDVLLDHAEILKALQDGDRQIVDTLKAKS